MKRAFFFALWFLGWVTLALAGGGGKNDELPAVAGGAAVSRSAWNNHFLVTSPAPNSNVTGAGNVVSGVSGRGLINVSAYFGLTKIATDVTPTCTQVSCSWSISVDVSTLPAGVQTISFIGYSKPSGQPGGVYNQIDYPLTVVAPGSNPATYVGATQNGVNSASASCTPAIVTGTLAGDVEFAYVVSQATAPGPTPAGWTAATINGNPVFISGGSQSAKLYWRVFVGGDAAPTFTGLSYPVCVLRTYRNVNQTTPIDAWIGLQCGPNAGTCVIPALAATANANETAVASYDFNSDPADITSGPSGFADAFTFHIAGLRALWSGDNVVASTGSVPPAMTATANGTPDGNYIWDALAWTIIPAGGAPVLAAPSFTTNPQSASVAVGQSATFGPVSASGYPTPTYKWQLSTDGGNTWTDIAGATAPTCTTPVAIIGMNGYRYRAVATNSQGSANSTVATLTVTQGGASTTFNTTWPALPNPPPGPNNTKAIPALAFNSSVGSVICGQSGCCSGCTAGTGNQSNDSAMLRYVGAKITRSGQIDTTWVSNVLNAVGAKLIWLTSDVTLDVPTILSMSHTLKNNGVLAVIEEMNEPENGGYTYNGFHCGDGFGTWIGCAKFGIDLHAAVRGDSQLNGIPVSSVTNMDQQTDNQGLQWAWPSGIAAGAGALNPTGTVFSDIGATHMYTDCCGNQCPCPPNQAWDQQNPTGGSVWYSDFVGHFPGISSAQSADVLHFPRINTEWDCTPGNMEYQAVCVVDYYIDALARGGFSATNRFGIIEAFFNNAPPTGQYHQGFYCNPFAQRNSCNDFSPSTFVGSYGAFTSADYVHSMTHFLADSGDVINPGTLNGLGFAQSCPTGGNTGASECHFLLLQKSTNGLDWNGNPAYGQGHYFVVADYEPADNGPSIPMTMNFGQTFAHANLFDLTKVVTPSQTAPSSNPTVITSCSNCASISWTWGYSGHPSGGMPPPVVIELW